MSLKKLQRELAEIRKELIPNCSTGPVTERLMYDWIAEINGPEGTPYAGGFFQLKAHFPIDYPFRPPNISFVTKIYHANINRSGKSCEHLSILREKWSPACSLRDVLQAIMSLMANPKPDECTDSDIKHLYETNKAKYDEVAQEWTRKFAC